MKNFSFLLMAILAALIFASCGGSGTSQNVPTSVSGADGSSSGADGATNGSDQPDLRPEDSENQKIDDGLTAVMDSKGKILNMRSEPYDPCAVTPCKKSTKSLDTIESRKIRYLQVQPQSK